MKSVWITGAAGFVGRHTVQAFVDDGWRVLAGVHRNLTPSLEELVRAGAVDLVRADVSDAAELTRALDDTLEARSEALQAIVHCAARVNDVGRGSKFERANVEGTRNVVSLAKRLDVPRFVHCSTTDVYGLTDFTGQAEEDLPLATHEIHPYVRTKIRAEGLVRDTLGLERWAIVRPAHIWGADDPHITQRMVDFLRVSPLILHAGRWRGDNRIPLSHVRNVAAALHAAATRPEAIGKAMNVLDAERTTQEEFFRLLAELHFPERRFRSVSIPTWLGYAAGAAVSAMALILNQDEPITDPSLYGARATTANLDLCNRRFLDLMNRAGQPVLSREEGLAEIRDGLAASPIR